MSRSSINESLRKHLASEPIRYHPETHEPLTEEQRRIVHDTWTSWIREGHVEVVGERDDGKLVYKILS
jgi:hypothetical protein